MPPLSFTLFFRIFLIFFHSLVWLKLIEYGFVSGQRDILPKNYEKHKQNNILSQSEFRKFKFEFESESIRFVRKGILSSPVQEWKLIFNLSFVISPIFMKLEKNLANGEKKNKHSNWICWSAFLICSIIIKYVQSF